MQFDSGTQLEVLVLVCGGVLLLAAATASSMRQAVLRAAPVAAVTLCLWWAGIWQGEFFPGTLGSRDAQAHWLTSSLILALLVAFALGAGRVALALGLPALCLLELPRLMRFWFPAMPNWLQWGTLGVALLVPMTLPYLLKVRSKLQPRRFWLIAIWCALVVSLVENGIRYIRWLNYDPLVLGAQDVFALLPSNAYWLVPLGDLLALVGLAVLVSLPACCWDRCRLSTDALFLVFFPASLILVSRAAPTLDAFAALAASAGLAAGLLKLALQSPERFGVVVHRTTPWLAAITLLVGVGAAGWQSFRNAPVDANSEASQSAPNVLLIVLDTVRAQSLSLYGYDRDTSPRLVDWGKRGVVFDRAIAPCSWTLPTHATIFTGRMPHEHRADAQVPLDNAFPTLAENLASRGYQTAGIVANREYCGVQSGLNRGFAHYDDHDRALEEMAAASPVLSRTFAGFLPSIRKTAVDINREFLTWLGNRKRGPFFAFLNYYDAHEPYFIPDSQFDRFRDSGASRREPIVAPAARATPDQVRLAIDTYDGAIAYLDHHLGALLDELHRRGILDNTCVIITSDHGESFGEQGEFGHGWNLYRQQIGVPLLILYPPGIKTPRHVTSAVSLLDLPSTILDVAAPGIPNGFEGASLARFWLNEPPPSSTDQQGIVSELITVPAITEELRRTAPVLSLIEDGLHYVATYGAQREELFDLERDPSELNSLANTDAGKSLLPKFRESLKKAVATNESSVPPIARKNAANGNIHASSDAE